MENDRKQLKAWVSLDTYNWLRQLVIMAGHTYGTKDVKPHWGEFFQAWRDGKYTLVPTEVEKEVDN